MSKTRKKAGGKTDVMAGKQHTVKSMENGSEKRDTIMLLLSCISQYIDRKIDGAEVDRPLQPMITEEGNSMTHTKVASKMIVNKRFFRQLAEKMAEYRLESDLGKLIDDIEKMHEEISLLMKNNKYIEFFDKGCRYYPKVAGLLPDMDNFTFAKGTKSKYDSEADYMTFDGFHGDLLTEVEVKRIIPNTPIEIQGCRYITIRDNSIGSIWIDDHKIPSGSGEGLYIPIFCFDGIDSKGLNAAEVTKHWIEYGLVPKDLSAAGDAAYRKLLRSLKKDDPSWTAYDKLFVEGQGEDALSDAERKCLFAADYGDNIADIMKEKKHLLKGKELAAVKLELKNGLLNSEYHRAGIAAYAEKILTDPNAGHWDLWEGEQADRNDDMYLLEGDLGFIARDPAADIRENSVVGIDFGTKSTVVTYLDNNRIMPMRIGTGDLSKKINARHYENPTVMEFVDLRSFLECYDARAGRPDTAWQDVLVSHTAADDLLNASSNEFNAFINELKQWAGDEDRAITIRDKQGMDVVLPPFDKIDGDRFNPIEIYAYYIGVFINNMWNGIFLDYMLSFPVTYDLSTRERIAGAFEKGLKKSLPPTILNSQEQMSRFRINADISEPAAYAVCALQEYGFQPSETDKVFYGIFDFGGGTTDYDFGVWRGAGREERRYDYVIEHFGAGGDKNLGGENLLELLAFEVFKDNQDKMRENKITFTLPPECRRFAGSEAIISDKQEARQNTRQLMEKLRPLWERTEDYEKTFSTGVIKVKLFNSSGVYSDYDLHVEQEELEKLLSDRIESGVSNFFAALEQAFTFDATFGVSQVNIFMGGNSSRSQIVADIFAQYIKSETEKIAASSNSDNREYFRIFPPLGSEESRSLLDKLGINSELDDIEKPNCKTGVAFGLVKCRKGSRIKVVDKGKVSKGDLQEIVFQYFLGTERRSRFTILEDLHSTTQIVGKPDYNKWYCLLDAGVEDFEIYYTGLPEAVSGELLIEDVLMKRLRTDVVDEKANVYIRACAPREIEYVVATGAGIAQGEYLGKITKVELEDN